MCMPWLCFSQVINVWAVVCIKLPWPWFGYLQGTSDFRLLWGAVSTLCLGEGLWTLFLLCPTLSASPAFLSHRSDLYSCLPIPGEDWCCSGSCAGQAGARKMKGSLVLVQGQPWKALCVRGWGVRLFQICLFSLGQPYSPFCVWCVCVSLSGWMCNLNQVRCSTELDNLAGFAEVFPELFVAFCVGCQVRRTALRWSTSPGCLSCTLKHLHP